MFLKSLKPPFATSFPNIDGCQSPHQMIGDKLLCAVAIAFGDCINDQLEITVRLLANGVRSGFICVPPVKLHRSPVIKYAVHNLD